MKTIYLCCFLLLGKVNVLLSQDKTSGDKLFFEKVYLHTDREIYASGDDIWFKAYLVNGQTNQLFNSSNNLYVELITPESKVSERKVVRLDNGTGKGDFKLGDSIPSGTYRIRAYTNWMRNFGDNFFFEKNITIFANYEVKVAAENTNIEKPALASVFNEPNVSPLPGIRFFPEGGSLIENVSGIVAFKAEDINGRGVSAEGAIYSGTGERITDFKCDTLGMGRFLIKVTPGNTYEAKGTYGNGRTFKLDLPKALSKDLSMYVRNADSAVRVTISTNALTLKDLKNRQLVLLAKSKGKASFVSQIPVNELQTVIAIPKHSLPAGITALTLFDHEGRPQCERLVYNEENKVSLSITTDKQSYGSKEKVLITLKAIGTDSKPVQAKLSLAVIEQDLVPESKSNILSYLYLQSEIRGNIDNPKQYFDERNDKRQQQLDLLLLTQGWREYTWRRLADSVLKVSHALEQGITIKGRVREVSKDKPVSGANITLSAFGAKEKRLFSTRTDSTGNYYFDGVQLYGSHPIALTSRNAKGEKNGWISIDSLFDHPPIVKPDNQVYMDTLLNEAFLTSATERKNSIKKNQLSDTVTLKDVEIKTNSPIRIRNSTLTKFGYHDEVFNIEPKDHDYTNLRHYLLHHSSANLDSNDKIGWYYEKKWHYPQIVVNNKELQFDNDDTEISESFYGLAFNMPTAKFSKIVIKHALSLNGTNGKSQHMWIIYLTMDPAAFNDEYDKIKKQVEGYYNARTFYAPDYEKLSQKPDLRTTIHWEPNITTNETGEATITYYNADPRTKIRVIAEGVTDKGEPVWGTVIYEVK